MKPFVYRIMFVLSLLTFGIFSSQATTLGLGDIAFTGYNSDDPDEFTFVLLKDIDASTQVTFTDKGWFPNNTFNTSEGTLTITFSSDQSCGDEFRLIDQSGWTFFNRSGASAGSISEVGSFALSSSGDQIFAYQGSPPTTETASNWIAAIHMNCEATGCNATLWDEVPANAVVSGSPESSKPSIFSTSNSVFGGENDAAKYDCSITSGNDLQNALNTDAKWAFSENRNSAVANFCPTPLSCPATCTPGVVNSINGSPGPLCPSSLQTLSVPVQANLNDDQEWVWYTGSCGGTEVSRGTSKNFNVSPTTTTTYYVRAEGTCSGTTGACASLTIMVEDTVDPVVSCPSNISVNNDPGQCSAVVSFTATASDNCGGDVDITYSQNPGTVFPRGTTLVNVTAKDETGNAKNCSFNVTVNDTEAPTAKCPGVIFDVELDLMGNGILTANIGDGNSTDNCGSIETSPELNFTCDDLGVQTVTLTANDLSGGISTIDCSFNVVDNVGACCTPGVVNSIYGSPGPLCPSSTQTLSVPNPILALNDDQSWVWYTGSCGGTQVATGPNFNVSPTATTTYYVRAEGTCSGTSGACAEITITVDDNVDPEASCPGNISVNNDPGLCSAVVSFSASGTDNCGGTVAITYSQNPGTAFNVGTTTVNVTATDDLSNTDNCSFLVIVADNELPTLTCQDITVELGATGTFSIFSVAFANDNIFVTQSDNCGLLGTVGFAGGTLFTCDNVGIPNSRGVVKTDVNDNNSAPCIFNVTVTDPLGVCNQPPVAKCKNITVSTALNTCEASITPAQVDDNSTDPDGDPLQLSLDNSGPFAPGTHTVELTVSDGSLSAKCTSMVTVEDNQVPAFSNCPGNISVSNDQGDCGAKVNWTPPTLSDNCPATAANSTHNPGDFFPVGSTTVTYTGSDAAGNPATDCSFVVTVNDTENPTITCPSGITVSNDAGSCDAEVTVPIPNVSDNCSSSTTTALDFDGNDDVVNLGSANNMGTSDFTVECWFKADNVIGTNSNGGTYLVGRGITTTANPSGSGFGLRLNKEAGQNELSFIIGPGSIKAPTIINTGTWYHAAGVRDGNEIKLYLNGNLVNTVSTGSVLNVNTPNLPFGIGAIIRQPFGSNTTSFDGKIDEVRLWNKALSDDAIGCNAKQILTGSESGLIAYYNMENGIGGGILNDQAGSADGSLQNMDASTQWVSGPSFPLGNYNLINDFTGICDASGTYPVGSTVVKFTVEDAAGNKKDCSFTVTVNDTENPLAVCNEITVNLVDQNTYNLTQTDIDAIAAGSSDNCPGVTYDVTGGPTAYDCDDVGQSFFITLTVTDANGLDDKCQVSLQVEDANGACNAAPIAVCKDITVDADVNCQGSAVATDFDGGSTDSDGDLLTFSVNPTGPYPIGVTNVVLTVTDPGGLNDQCDATITVEDNTDPVINCPADIVVDNDPGQCGAIVNYIATATDNCPGVGVVVDPLSGSFFSVGTTSVLATATDASGNTAQCTFNVTVNDNEDPVIACPGDITVNNDPGQCGAAVNYSVAFSDNCPGVGLVVNPASGSFFGVGTTSVLATATDAAGRTAQCGFNVTVNDTEDPVIACPGDITVNNDPGQCGVAVNYSVAFSDNCPGAGLVVNPASGSFFGVGTTSVLATATDAAGRTAQCGFNVTVNDNEVPVFSNCPGTINVFNDAGECGALVNWTPPALTDNCPGATSDSSHDPGDFFDVGTTTVTYSGSDAAGNDAVACSFTVSVTDNEKPNISCPANISTGTDVGQCGAEVTFSPAFANDNCAIKVIKARYRPVDENNSSIGSWTSRVVDPSGFFPVGRYQVQWRAEDIYGNKKTCSHYLDVYDDEDPVAVCKDVTVDFNGEEDINLSVSQVWDEAASSDNCGNVSYVGTSPGLSIDCDDLGKTVALTVTIKDEEGNEDECTSYVSVIGLPCGWAEGPQDGSLNCGNDTSSDYDVDDESFTLTADGCWHDCRESDKAAFVYHELCGDGQLTARLADINTSGYAGLMARESLDPDARRAGVLKNYSTRRVRREYRAEYGGVVTQRLSNRSRVEWLRIVRQGNSIKSYTSTNGSSWRLLYKVTYPDLADCLYLGMTAYSLNGSSEVEAVFDNVSITSSGSLAGGVGDQTNAPGQMLAYDIAGNIGNGEVDIFPNPANNETQIVLNGFEDKPAQIIIRDQFGRLVRQIDVDSAMGLSETIPVNDLAAGIYLVSIIQDQRMLVSKKLVVQP